MPSFACRRMSGSAWILPVWGRRSASPRSRANRSDGQRGDRIPYTSTRARHAGCEIETVGGLSLEYEVYLFNFNSLNDLRADVFPGKEDGADE